MILYLRVLIALPAFHFNSTSCDVPLKSSITLNLYSWITSVLRDIKHEPMYHLQGGQFCDASELAQLVMKSVQLKLHLSEIYRCCHEPCTAFFPFKISFSSGIQHPFRSHWLRWFSIKPAWSCGNLRLFCIWRITDLYESQSYIFVRLAHSPMMVIVGSTFFVCFFNLTFLCNSHYTNSPPCKTVASFTRDRVNSQADEAHFPSADFSG